jgi:hypothetical protein
MPRTPPAMGLHPHMSFDSFEFGYTYVEQGGTP